MKPHTPIDDSLLNTIYLGNCLELLKKIPDESITLVVSSPPYNIGKEYEKKSHLDEYLDSQRQVLKECARILNPMGSIFWQIGSYVNDGVHIPLDIRFFPIFEELCFVPRNRIIWIRPHGLHARNRFSCRHETILWFTKSDNYIFNLDPIRVPQKYPNKKSWIGPNKGKLTCNPIGKNPGDVWAFRNVKHNHEEQTIHPCQFPEDLIERIVLAVTNLGDVVLDPYMGSGTVAVVAKKLGRNFLGAELLKEYYDVAIERLSGNPDINNRFPNLKALREYCDAMDIQNPDKYSFTMQVGDKPTLKRHSKIFPEQIHLERFIETTCDESSQSAYSRGLVDLDNTVNDGNKIKPIEQDSLFKN